LAYGLSWLFAGVDRSDEPRPGGSILPMTQAIGARVDRSGWHVQIAGTMVNLSE
jgi:hypothetical protein